MQVQLRFFWRVAIVFAVVALSPVATGNIAFAQCNPQISKC
jgi:hypothetical protein